MPLLYSLENDKKDKHEYAVITGFEGSVTDLVVPEEIEGHRVEAIGNHAFSGRQDLLSVELPGSIRILYGFAFHNCRKLKKITLFDSLQDYYDGVCRQCDSLEEVDITIRDGWYEVVRNFLADNDKTLRFVLHVQATQDSAHETADLASDSTETTACLTFPEYVYDFNENTMARTIQFSIAGSGMFYRECVDRRSINYRQYDSLFEKAVIDGNAVSEDIAIGRLLYPVELSDAHRRAYEDFVAKNAGNILTRLVKESVNEPDNIGIVRSLLTYGKRDDAAGPLLDSRSIDEAIRLSTDEKLTVMSAVLLEGAGASAGPKAMTFDF
jgi:hypothetical protein